MRLVGHSAYYKSNQNTIFRLQIDLLLSCCCVFVLNMLFAPTLNHKTGLGARVRKMFVRSEFFT